MEQNFIVLGDVIVKALPTFFLVVLLYFYLKKVLFQPLERVIQERGKATDGKVAEAEAALARAAENMRSYERAINEARAAIYADQEQNRKLFAQTQAKTLEDARQRASGRLAAAKAEIRAEVEKTSAALAEESDRLAEQIAAMVLAGRRN